jgi:hypothetical protein
MWKRKFSKLALCSSHWRNVNFVIYLSLDNFLVKSVFTWRFFTLDGSFFYGHINVVHTSMSPTVKSWSIFNTCAEYSYQVGFHTRDSDNNSWIC